MAQIFNVNFFYIKKDKRGVLLTLGITFLSLVVLALATIVLRNAESSEDRLVELAGIDRLYNLGSSTERTLALALYPYTGLNVTVSNVTLVIERQMYPYPDKTLWSLDPSFFDYQLIIRLIYSEYLKSVSKNVNSVAEANPLTRSIRLDISPVNFFYWLNTENITLNDPDQGLQGEVYKPLHINTNSSGPTNSTLQLLFFSSVAQLNPYIITNYTFYFQHDTRNGIINWSRREVTTGDRKVRITIQIDGPNGYKHIVSDDVYINGTNKRFPQVIYLDNLTGDQGCISLGCGIIEVPELRPMLRFYEGASTGLGQSGAVVGGQATSFFIANFNEKLFARTTMILNTTYIEVKGSQYIIAQLSSFNMTRSHFARYL